ncbi:polysaccharide deacetylase family protein [Polynucleobacter sinensis]|jgi:peptidoglycan/xylan/chitin deacetylase (PgdA/CDA1 family)|uniref:polysaccharide deacetylase family protein n=1 Tax=Polynucleobacter sinensis TaxID=1743157 RepID=UPI000785F1B3|nr:polysaccharide deacetylase family protein [Polynucleobacter sinensis]
MCLRMKIAGLLALTILGIFSSSSPAQEVQCKKTVYLTFDTGNMSVAQTVADILNRQNVKATFFLANEKTSQGNFSLDDFWKTYWQERVKEGHHFGSHTFDHLYFIKDGALGEVIAKPQFGPKAGVSKSYSESNYCREIRRVDERFKELTGSNLEKIWRAPGGKTSPRLIQMGEHCGYQHIGWSPAGFLGDELNSQTHPNPLLLERASQGLRDGDITMAHLGIWSRKDPWAPAVLEQLIINLKNRGFCFATLPKSMK